MKCINQKVYIFFIVQRRYRIDSFAFDTEAFLVSGNGKFGTLVLQGKIMYQSMVLSNFIEANIYSDLS